MAPSWTLSYRPRSTKDTRKDSAISIKPPTPPSPAPTSPQNPLTISTSTPAPFSLPRPDPPDRLSPLRKLLRRRHITPHPKTLHELVSSACQTTCSLILRRSTLSSGANLIVTDPAVVDLLLTCISSVEYNKRFIRLNLLPGCPISKLKIREVVDAMPALATLDPGSGYSTPSTSVTVRSTQSDTPRTSTTTSISTSTSTPVPTSPLSTLSPTHQRLLTWLLHSPLMHLTSLHPYTHPLLTFPSLTTTTITPFFLTRQPPSREAHFAHHSSKHAPIPVFHGTHPSRLPSILSSGLKNMSGTRYQSNGKAKGRGIYLATYPETSVGYAYEASAWPGSVWNDGRGGDVRVLLGCELAGVDPEKTKHTYVVKDEGRVVVRVVFLLVGERSDVGDGEGGVGLRQELERVCGVLREMRGS